MKSNNPVALVTGASKRTGRAIALALINDGYNLALHYRTSDKKAQGVVKTAKNIRPDVQVELFKADFDKPNELEGLVGETAKRFVMLDLLVNYASSFMKTPIDNLDLNELNLLHKVHVIAPAVLSIKAAHLLKLAKPGHIINIVDIFTNYPRLDYTSYTISKAGLKALTGQLALEFAPGILVNAISPGAISEPEDGLTQIERQALLNKIPLDRFGSPEDIANAVLFLSSSNYITGQTIAVDGGRTLVT